MADRREPEANPHSKRRWSANQRRLLFIAAGVLLETAALRQRAHRLGGNVIVRCRQNHLFTTIWIPAVSLKALRLVWWRGQYCPVGGHWTIVTPVHVAALSDDERSAATQSHDIRIP
jgi:hypothetical protein